MAVFGSTSGRLKELRFRTIGMIPKPNCLLSTIHREIVHAQMTLERPHSELLFDPFDMRRGLYADEGCDGGLRFALRPPLRAFDFAGAQRRPLQAGKAEGLQNASAYTPCAHGFQNSFHHV
jgi:hypothetical protein